MEAYGGIFRKPWFKLPIYTFAFGCAYYGGVQLPARIFPKLSPKSYSGVDHSVYSSSQDIVGKFRLFESPIDNQNSRDDIAGYLTAYN